MGGRARDYPTTPQPTCVRAVRPTRKLCIGVVNFSHRTRRGNLVGRGATGDYGRALTAAAGWRCGFAGIVVRGIEPGGLHAPLG
jgi:hypothetical protein